MISLTYRGVQQKQFNLKLILKQRRKIPQVMTEPKHEISSEQYIRHLTTNK